jgi:hypothetical protein
MSRSTRKFESEVLLSLEEAENRHEDILVYLPYLENLAVDCLLCQRRMRKCERDDSLLTTVFTKNISYLNINNKAVREMCGFS